MNCVRGVVDRVVLVNPATSYEQSVWPTIGPLLTQIPKEAHGLLPFALSPILANPIQLLARTIDTAATPDVVAGQLLEVAIESTYSIKYLNIACHLHIF